MKNILFISALFVAAAPAMAGEGGLLNYPKTKVESTKTREEVKAELAKWLADADAQKAHRELYGNGGGSK